MGDSIKINKMKVCLISRSYPRDTMPGAGLPEYFFNYYIEEPTLHIIKKLPGKLRPQKKHVIIKEIVYPESTSQLINNSFWKKLFIIISKLFSYLIFLFKSIPAMVCFRPDIIHIISPLLILHGIFGKIFLRSKLVISVIGTDSLRLKKSKFLQILMKAADKVCYVSEDIRNILLKFLPKTKLEYVPRGVDTKNFKNLHLIRKKQIIAIGALKWQKGYNYLIEAMPQVVKKHKNYILLIIGEGPLRKELENQIKKAKLEDKIKLLGICSRKKIINLLNESKLLVMSSISEGFPKVMIEAAACGTPVVVTDVGNCRKAQEEGFGLVVKPQNSIALAQAINTLLEDNQLWKKFSEKGTEVAKKYDWKEIAKKIHNIYKELVEK